MPFSFASTFRRPQQSHSYAGIPSPPARHAHTTAPSCRQSGSTLRAISSSPRARQSSHNSTNRAGSVSGQHCPTTLNSPQIWQRPGARTSGRAERRISADSALRLSMSHMLASCVPLLHHLPMSDEQACPGTCNRRWREARKEYRQALADYDPLDSGQSRPDPPSVQPWPGDPWCGRCKSRIRETLAELDDLAALLLATADGHRAAPGGQRVSGTSVQLSPSEAGDDLAELAAMLSGWEEAYRDLKDWPSLASRGHLASAVTTCIAWLMAHLDEILVAPFAADLGGEILQWHKEFISKTKAGTRTLRKPLRCPRPQCRLLTLTWTEGDTYVICSNPDCGAHIPLAEYEMETARLGEALERGELEAEVA